jgi:hypothetical protein
LLILFNTCYVSQVMFPQIPKYLKFTLLLRFFFPIYHYTMAILDYHRTFMFDLLIKICHVTYNTSLILSRSLNTFLLREFEPNSCEYNEALLNSASAYFPKSLSPTLPKACCMILEKMRTSDTMSLKFHFLFP